MATITMLDRSSLGAGNRIAQKLSNGTVIKFGCPNDSRSGGQNVLEASTWRRIRNIPGILDIVMPVVDSAADGSWLLMPLASERSWNDMSREDRAQWRDDMDALRRRASAAGLDRLMLDAHMGNVRYNERGMLVLIDYGYTEGPNGFGRWGRECDGCTWIRLNSGEVRAHGRNYRRAGW